MAAAVLVCTGLAIPAGAGAQTQGTQTAPRSIEVQLFVEPVRAGAQVLLGRGPVWRAGLALGAGPSYAVTLRSAETRDVRSWAGAWAVVSARARNGIGVSVSPIGAALVIGNDFSAVYPSGEIAIAVGQGRVRGGSLVRVIRIAGGFGTGTWWTQWVPVRVSLVFR